MTMTNTLTQMSSLRLRVENRNYSSWPNPENSIDNDIDSIPIGDKHYWHARHGGPARQAYETINPKIKETLEQRDAELYSDIKEASIPHSWCCFMVGKKISKACPFIVITCSHQFFGMRIIDIIKDCSWWEQFIQKYSGFGRFSLLNCHPARMGNSNSGEYVWAYPGWDEALYDIPIYAARDESKPIDNQATRNATIGGILYVDDMPFSLTVAHPFVSQHDHVNSFSDDSVLGAYYEDSIDDGSSSDDPSDSDTTSDGTINHDDSSRTKSAGFKPERSPQSASTITNPDPLEALRSGQHRFDRIGSVYCRTNGDACDKLDWALIRMTNPDNFDIDPHSMALGEYTTDDGFMTEVWGPEFIASYPLEAESVLVHGAQHQLIRGVLDPYESFVCLAGSRQYIKLSVVILSEAPTSGDCGKWVFDDKGYWYGHVIAGNRTLKTIYIASAIEIAESIGKATVFSRVRLGLETDLDEKLDSAIKRRDSKRIHELLNRGAKVDQGMTLFWPVAHGDLEIIRLLLAHSNIDVNRRIPLYEAVSRGHTEIIKLLLAHPNINVNRANPLYRAVSGGHTEIIRLLLAHPNIDVNGGNPLYRAVFRGHIEIVKLLLAHPNISVNRANPLYRAVSGGHTEIIRLLLAYPNIDVNGGSPLFEAVSQGRAEIVKLLLAQPNIDVKDRDLIFAAARSGSKETLELLLAQTNIDINHEKLIPLPLFPKNNNEMLLILEQDKIKREKQSKT